MTVRQIVLDTETTGLEVAEGHRIIEIGCVELKDRRMTPNRFHHYLNPERQIESGAVEVHGITREALAQKPRFADIAATLVEYLRGAELIIHNAEFDVGFLNDELARAQRPERIEQLCRVTDSLELARRLHPGQRNGLDALCRRYHVDLSQRELHGALLDAQLLAEVYLAMTGGQVSMTLDRPDAAPSRRAAEEEDAQELGPLVVVRASADELAAHRARLEAIAKKAGRVLWPDEGEGMPC